MSYREPTERAPRLWYVSTVSHHFTKVTLHTKWIWAVEGNNAVLQAERRVHQSSETPIEGNLLSFAICGDDFADAEKKGPPK